MRRSRISVKPNVRSGNRTGTIGEQVCEAERGGGGDPLPVDEAVEVVRPAPFHQQTVALNNPSENLAIVDVPGTPSGLNLNDGAPSSGAATSSAAPSRRMRILATPKLGPKHTSTPRTQTKCQARMSISAPAPIPNEEDVQIKNSASQASVSIISNELPESGSPRRSTSPTNLPAKCLEMTNTSSLCVPSTSGFQKSTVHGKKSMKDSPPSPQPGQVPQKPSQEPEPPGCLSFSDLSSTCITPSQFDKTGSSEMTEKSSDKDRILRALKLKELMKIERRKDLQMKKRRVGHKEYTALDRSKMTMRDLIYFLPNTSPMRSSEEREENQAETIIPPSPRQQIKTAERDDEDEEESDNEEMLVPKVRVAEDGSIILDEESLSVRVQRTSNTKVLEGSMALFERGSTTTYTSFRTTNHVKSWSVRETDLFFLAISMVGTDFTLVGQLLSHRSRIAIKNKFKKEERLNPWRVDKALRNKRPYDKEFFSYLQEKILAKDKDKRKSVKLILPKTKKKRKSKGKTSNRICISDKAGDDDVFSVDDYGDLADDADVLVEKENEDVSNLKEENPSVPAKKRCKRTRDVHKDKDKNNSVEKQVKRKRQRKCSKNTSEVHSKEDTEGLSSLSVEGDTINLDKEDELARSTSASKRRRKSSKSSEEKQTEKPAKEKKAKQRKKSCKVVSDHEESVGEHEDGSIVDENGSPIKKKRKQAKNSDLNEDEAGKGKKNRKRKKAQKSTVEEEGTAEGEASLDLQEAKEFNAPDTAEVPPKTTKRSKKLLHNLAATRKKKCNKPEAAADIKTESQYENNHESILTAAGSPVQDERLQMQAAVVLEKTPPRQLNSLSPSKVQCKNQDLEPSMSSNASSSSIECSTQQARKHRAGRVKRDLSTSGKLESKEKIIDQDVAEPVSTMGLLEQIIQDSENLEEDNSMNENLIDLSCLPDLDSQMFQRRPMVVLSREEVDMVFHAPDHSDDEDPSVSPLDLSLNTELSFPLQCSKLLMDDDEAEVEDCVFEENEERTNERASCEERTYEDLELTESALAQPDISNIRDIPSCLKPEVCSQPEVGPSKVTTSCSMEEAKPNLHPMACEDGTTALEGSPPLVVVDNVDLFCMNPDTPMAQETTNSETITHGTSLVISNVMEQSEKYMPPILPKESAPASSEITPYSKPTPIESELGSLRSLQATQELKEELQTSLEGQTLDTLHDLSENIKGTQESLIASPEVKVRMQGCAVAPELKEDFQEDVSVQASSASGSSELCIKPTRRSRILKPKPNLSQKSRGPALLSQRRNLKTHSTFEPKSSQPSVSTERLPHSPATDQHDAFKDISKQKLNKDVETSRSHAMDQMESESVPDLSDSSKAVPDLQSVAAVTQNPASTDEPQVASECSSSKFVGYVGKISPCTSLPFPPPSQTREDTGIGQMIVPSEDVCAPAEILHLTEDGHNGEEPTFILTLYEIPVKHTYLPSSSNDCVMALDLPTVGKQASLGFSDQTHTLSTSESFRTDSIPMEGSGTEKVYLQNDLGVITKDLAENSKEQISAHTSEIISLQTKDEGTSANLHSGSECTETLPQDPIDTEQCEKVSHLVSGDLVVPVSEKSRDISSKDWMKAVKSKLHSKEDSTVSLPERQDTPCEELAKVGDLSAVSNPLCLDSTEKSKDVPLSSEKKKAPARRRERQIKPQPKLVKRAHAKVESSKTAHVKESSPQTTSQIVLPSSHQGNLASISNTTDEKSVKSISSIEGNMTSVSKGKEIKPKSTAEESPKMSQGDLDLESKHISSALQICRNPKLDEERRENITGHTIIKDDIKSSADDKELSMAVPNEGAIVKPCCEDRSYSLMKASGSLTVDSEKTEAESDWSLENSLPRAGEHFQKELKIEHVSQTLIEDSPQSPLMDNNSPVRKSGKQEVKRACSKNDPTETMLSSQTSPEAAASSPQLTNLPPNENMVLLEEQLQRKHHIMPCTVHLSSLDTAAWSLKPPQCGDLHRHNESTVMSSRSVTNISEASCIPSLSEEMKLAEPELEKKSPTRSKGTKNESSTDRKCGHSNPVQTISQTRQLTITDWVKRKLHQTAENQEEKESEKSLQMHTRLKAKDVHQLRPKKTLLKSENPEELEGSHLAPTLDENKEVKKSSEMVKESAEIPSVSQVKKSPARRRAKLQVKPILKKRARIRSEGETSTSDQPQPSRSASPTRQHARAAREKQESDHEAILPVKEDLNISSMEADSKSAEASLITSGSPISQDTWPRVVLPRVKLCTTEAGICSPSTTSTFSPARDSQSAPQSVTPPQLKKSPTQRSSPTANENPDNDPSRVSQFFLCDIFTEVDE